MTTSTRPKPKFWALTGETAKAAVRLYFDPLHRIAGRGRGVEQEHVRTGVLEIVRVLVRQMRMELEVLTSTPFGGSDSKVEEVLLDLLEHELKTMAILTKTLAREQVLVRNRQFGLRHSLEQALQESEKQLSASDVEQAWELERAWELEQVLFEAQNSAQILKDVLWDKQSLALDLRATGERIKTLEQVIERVRAGKLELELKLEQLRGSRLDLEESQIEGELEKIRTRALEGRQITGELEEIRTRLFGLEREIDRERNQSTELVNSLSGLLGLTTELEQIVVKGRDQCLMREREQDQVRALERARAHTPGRVGTWLSKAMSIRGSLPRR